MKNINKDNKDNKFNKINKDNKQFSSFKKTTSARRAIMQALYTWVVSKNDLLNVGQYYLQERNPKNFNKKYFLLLLKDIPKNIEKIDQAISDYSDIDIDKLDIIELCILRIACYEVLFCLEIPIKVIISEALNLAIMFGNHNSYKFINGVLDRLAKNSRKI